MLAPTKEKPPSLRPRACDFCRKKKIRCDGPESPQGPCTNCVASKEECTYLNPTGRKREPSQRYVRELETRLKHMQVLVDKYSPAKARREEDSQFLCLQKLNPFPIEHPAPIFSDVPCLCEASASVLDDSEDDGEVVRPHPNIAILRMAATAPEHAHRWHGQGSGLSLLYTAHEIKQQVAKPEDNRLELRPLQPLTPWERSCWDLGLETGINASPSSIEFPPKDLILHLFDLFFRYITPFFPIIHRPTFEVQYADGLHERDTRYSRLVLMICATASIYSDDPRVLHEVNNSRIPGYQYFLDGNNCTHSAAQLPDLQICVLRAIYFDYIGQRHAAWFMLGAGIRFAQDVGAHRKSFKGSTKPVEKEMWRRTFWCLVTLDRLVSLGIGQTPAVKEEDIGVVFPSSLPLEDPCEMQYFNTLLNLGALASKVLRTLYSIRPWSKTVFGEVPRENVIARLDHAMSKWASMVPSHLRWDPHQENITHLEQSAELQSMFYLVVIMVHRPNITRRRQSELERNQGLGICTSAARSCTRVVSVFSRRSILVPCHAYTAAFASAAILMTAIWTRKHADPEANVIDLETDMLECVYALRRAEKRWVSAGRMVDILHELAATSDIHFPDLSVPVSENVASDDRSLQEKLLDQMMSENFRGANFTRDDSPDSTMPSMPTPPDSHDSSDCPDIRLSHTIFDSKPDCATENEFWRTLYSATEWQNWAPGLAQNLRADPRAVSDS